MTPPLSELLIQCRNSDQDAIRILVEQFAPAAHTLAQALLQDQHLAEDAVQAAFITALTRLDQLRQPEAFAPWLRQIVRTQCTRILRRKQPQPAQMADETPAATPSPEENLQEHELCDLVHKALRQIPPLGRQTAELYYFEDRSLAEVAQILRVPEGTVKRRLHDVRAQLRTILLGYLNEIPPQAEPPARHLPF